MVNFVNAGDSPQDEEGGQGKGTAKDPIVISSEKD